MGKIKILAVAFCSLFIIVSCAKRGTITGGDKDITPPKITSSNPKNFSTNFSAKTIKINFNEYIKIKDLQKNLIISPPMETPATILPQGGASKYLTIKINDTLKANTTYSFNFGESIVDNNEGNVLPQLKYVFSTGALIDSLTVEGIIKDSYEKETDSFVNVMLYEVDEKYNDSIIYKQTPRYITNTLDSLKTFKIENVKAG
ncbi:MAG: Ig-like domain-containing protein, partial [Flavobacterium sp.]